MKNFFWKASEYCRGVIMNLCTATEDEKSQDINGLPFLDAGMARKQAEVECPELNLNLNHRMRPETSMSTRFQRSMLE